MKYEIRHRYTDAVLWSTEEAQTLRDAVEKAVRAHADLAYANLAGAYLTGAKLFSAKLTGANLVGANLTDAKLTGANLTDADLTDADLFSAYLTDANLTGANLFSAKLTGAKLTSANLVGAKLTDAKLTGANLFSAKLSPTTRIETGETWGEYLRVVVPAILVAGGKTVAGIVAKSWDCHTWENCPMAEAFSVHMLDEIPILYRPRADQFIHYFDAGLIPNPLGETEKAEAVAP